MKCRLTVIVALVSVVMLAATAQAAFENLMVSPRARAMGDASVVDPGSSYAATLNPARLALLSGRGQVSASYTQPYGLDFHKLVHMGAAFDLGSRGTLGVAYRQYGVDYQDTDLHQENTFTLAYGKVLYQDVHSSISLGVGLNLYRLEFGETVSGLDPGSDMTPGLDVGLSATLHGRTHVGVLVHNYNVPEIGRDHEELPRTLRAGIGYEPYDGVLTVFELENTHGEDPQWRGGVEVTVLPGLALRTGIMTNPSKLTGGFGYSFGQASLDYGFSTGGGVLENSHQFGLSWAWGGE